MTEAPIVQARLVVPSSPEHLTNVRELVEDTAGQVGFSVSEVQRIVTAAYEAVVNAATHGSPLGSQSSIEINVRAYSDRLVIEVQDQGDGFPSNISKRMPDTSSRRGRGIPLMHALVDEVQFDDSDGGKVTLTKYKR
jgi:anti-sigma regulatory factor (Ser/Thr protein kinase)